MAPSSSTVILGSVAFWGLSEIFGSHEQNRLNISNRSKIMATAMPKFEVYGRVPNGGGYTRIVVSAASSSAAGEIVKAMFQGKFEIGSITKVS